MAVSSLLPNRLKMLSGILHRFDTMMGSADRGFSHNALLAMTTGNITLKEHQMMSTDASATEPPINFSSYKAITTLSLSTSFRRVSLILTIQLNIALPTAANVIAGLWASADATVHNSTTDLDVIFRLERP